MAVEGMLSIDAEALEADAQTLDDSHPTRAQRRYSDPIAASPHPNDPHEEFWSIPSVPHLPLIAAPVRDEFCLPV
jgi:hypothetical protein